jgi:uncharacterized protein
VLIPADAPLAVAATSAVQSGDLAGLERLLRDHPELATVRIGTDGPDGMARTLLHAATDWPGHFPNNRAVVRMLVEAGADVNARFSGPHTETPLHWAASSDDVDVLDALLDAGAEIDATGGVIGGGTALNDATAFAQWNAARRLVERGAKTSLWDAAALGLMDRVHSHFAAEPETEPQVITEWFWAACHGGQRAAAEHLLERGADLNWVGYDGLTPIDAAQRNGFSEQAEWLRGRGAVSAEGGNVGKVPEVEATRTNAGLTDD